MTDGMSELDAVHRAGHLDVGENGVDVAAVGQYGHGLVGMRGLYHLKTSSLKEIHRVHPEQRLIFNDQDDQFRHG
ncbi:hypothetical protein SAMN04515666_10832 [Bosea lupini]|uniref:Uncharacterized protein n=1 Tax=Bosea lupini TaxID=1036779 RepID=A0A1H7W673_9HYPH|nr:hypothetical protein SAMN04515666_10832 [Bosea lupini]